MKLIDNCFKVIILTTFLFAQVHFENDIQPIFNANCIGCHPGNASFMLTANDSYDNLVNVVSTGYAPALRVIPGDPSGSVLWNKVAGTNVFGQQMPQGGSLVQAEINLIENWISEGALLDVDEKSGIPMDFALHQNYPNPFNPTTTIHYILPKESVVTITIYDMLGREITELRSLTQPSGSYSVQWSGLDSHGYSVSAGIYLYHIQAGEFVQTKKMVLLK